MTRPILLLAIASTVVVLLPRHADAQTAVQTAQADTAVLSAPGPTSTSNAQPPSAASPAAAADTRILSDPLFLPMKGQVYGVTAFTHDMPSGDNFKNGVQTGSFKASDNLFSQTLAFGLLNGLTFRLTEGYGANERDSTSAATGDVTTGNSKGFNDPTVGVTLRLVDQPRSPLILDLTASYSPDLIDSKSGGSSGSDGTMGRGGDATAFSLAVGHVAKSFTVAGTAGSTYVGQQMTDLLTNSTTSESDAHWSYNLSLNTQSRFNDRVSVDAGVALATAQTYNVSNTTTGNSHTYAPPDTRSLNLSLNYHFRPNHVVGEFTYSYNNDTEATNTFVKATSDTAVLNRMGNVVGFRMLYLFK